MKTESATYMPSEVLETSILKMDNGNEITMKKEQWNKN
jgi:hypothetical protein